MTSCRVYPHSQRPRRTIVRFEVTLTRQSAEPRFTPHSSCKNFKFEFKFKFKNRFKGARNFLPEQADPREPCSRARAGAEACTGGVAPATSGDLGLVRHGKRGSCGHCGSELDNSTMASQHRMRIGLFRCVLFRTRDQLKSTSLS